MTFDAIDGLSISGAVANVDPMGTVSSGVVSYTVQIAMDTTDDRVRPGMTVNASVVTNVKQNALIVPSSAVKTQNGSSYVLVYDQLPPGVSSSTAESAAGFTSTVAPVQQAVTVGLSNDTETEIISGIEEGQLVVTKTTTVTSTTAKTTSSSSILSALGSGGPPGAGAAGGARSSGATRSTSNAGTTGR
jgi:multidrug efflux pump subunit AcrA (membrane-fusion protein)